MTLFWPSCNCCGCVVFEDDFDPGRSSRWNVLSGTMTDTTYLGNPAISLATGTRAIIDGVSVPESGGIYALAHVAGSAVLDVMFGYQDSDNYNFVRRDEQGSPAAEYHQYFERRSGTNTAVGSAAKVFTPSMDLCWKVSDLHTNLVGFPSGERGMASMPGDKIGVYCPTGPAILYATTTKDFRAFRRDVDKGCDCGCSDCDFCASPIRPTQLDVDMLAGPVPSGETPCFCENTCEWEGLTDNGGLQFTVIAKVTFSAGEYWLTVTFSNSPYVYSWSKSLGASKPDCWDFDETFDVGDNVVNLPGTSDLTYTTVDVKTKLPVGW